MEYRAGMGSKQVLEMRQLVFLWFRPPDAWDYVAIFKCSCINYWHEKEPYCSSIPIQTSAYRARRTLAALSGQSLEQWLICDSPIRFGAIPIFDARSSLGLDSSGVVLFVSPASGLL